MDVLKGVTWPWPNLMPTFEALAQAKTTGSAWEAFDLNYMRKGDGVTMNRESVIFAAKQVALGMLEAGYQPPVPAKVKVMGYDGISNFRSVLYNMGQSRVHLRARPLSGREDRLRPQRRRGGPADRSGRMAPAAPRAQDVHGDLQAAQVARADPGHAHHRQTPPQLIAGPQKEF